MKKHKKKEELKDEKIEIENELNEEMSEEADSKSENENVEQADRLRELEEKNQELNDRLLRRVAEFENYKRRTETEKEILFRYAAEPFILKVLPIYDDIQRSLSHIEDDKIESVREGFKMIADKFNQVLTDQGVKKIETAGKEFDYEFHEALLQRPSEDIPENIILEEVESGYIYKDKVLKHAKVIVSQGAQEREEAQIDNEESIEE